MYGRRQQHVKVRGNQALPQVEQLVAVQPLQAEELEKELPWLEGSVFEPEPAVLNPQAERSLERFSLLQKGHDGISFPSTSVSKSFPHSLQLYSYIGIFLSCKISGIFHLGSKTSTRKDPKFLL